MFINLSWDYFDYYYIMEEYVVVKFCLFSEFNIKVKVLNVDDEIGVDWLVKLFDVIVVSVNFDF